jgi:hypothetical protein
MDTVTGPKAPRVAVLLIVLAIWRPPGFWALTSHRAPSQPSPPLGLLPTVAWQVNLRMWPVSTPGSRTSLSLRMTVELLPLPESM